MLEMREITFLDRGGDHTTVLQRKYSLSRLVLKPAITIGWAEGFVFYWLRVKLS